MYVYHLNPDIDDDSLIIPLINQIIQTQVSCLTG